MTGQKKEPSGEGAQAIADVTSGTIPVAGVSYFLCRLLPPRPSFVQDMNAEERALMQEHSVYWRTQMAAGRVVVFGPVGDPAGPWGLGIVRGKDVAEVHAFQQADPVIRAECGFRYEVLPMLTAVLPESL